MIPIHVQEREITKMLNETVFRSLNEFEYSFHISDQDTSTGIYTMIKYIVLLNKKEEFEIVIRFYNDNVSVQYNGESDILYTIFSRVSQDDNNTLKKSLLELYNLLKRESK